MQLTPLPSQHPALDALLHNLQLIYPNGRVEFARFQVNVRSLNAWFAQRTQADESALIVAFLNHPAVAQNCNSLHWEIPLEIIPELHVGSAFTLDGELAQALVKGGAYRSFSGSGAEAKAIGEQFCQALFDDRYTDIQIYKSFTAWSDWFYDVAWDCTWFGLDLFQNHIWLLAATDAD